MNRYVKLCKDMLATEIHWDGWRLCEGTHKHNTPSNTAQAVRVKHDTTQH